MNVLIVGEFSAFAKHLKAGFSQLGHSVNIISTEDGFKKLSCDKGDFQYNPFPKVKIKGRRLILGTLLARFKENRRINKYISTISKPDVIIVINHIFLRDSIIEVGVPVSFLEEMHKRGVKIVMSCCGGDPAYRISQYNRKLRYVDAFYPDGVTKSILYKSTSFDKLINLADLIIPIMYDYYAPIIDYVSEDNLDKIATPIPLPIKTEDVDVKPCGERIVLFHGITRTKGIKGSEYIIKALKMIESAYPDLVEVQIVEKLPYDEYVKLMDKVDILFDQTNSYGCGVNAEIGLMNGKVVFSGNEPENEEIMNLGKWPVINAIPDVDYLYKKIEELIMHPEIIYDLKVKSRNFVLKYLDAKIIAQRYLDMINKK